MLPVLLTDTVTPDIARAAHFTLLWGLEGVVLRTVGGEGERVPFVNEAKTFRRLREADLPVVALDPGLLEGPADARGAWRNDVAALPETAAFARRAGAGLVLTGALPGGVEEAAAALRLAGDAAARLGVTLAVRNEAEGRATAADLAAVLGAADHPHVRAAWSPADALAAGEDARAGLDALAGRLALVTVRDGARVDGEWEERVPGEGAVGWADVLGGLHAAGWDGPLCLDVRGGTRAGLAGATALIHLIRGVRRR